MIQRRVKWKKGVTAEKSSMQAGRGLGNSRRAGEGCVCVRARGRVYLGCLRAQDALRPGEAIQCQG